MVRSLAMKRRDPNPLANYNAAVVRFGNFLGACGVRNCSWRNMLPLPSFPSSLHVQDSTNHKKSRTENPIPSVDRPRPLSFDDLEESLGCTEVYARTALTSKLLQEGAGSLSSYDLFLVVCYSGSEQAINRALPALFKDAEMFKVLVEMAEQEVRYPEFGILPLRVRDAVLAENDRRTKE